MDLRSGGETDTTRSDWEREDLANHDPSARTPSRGEEEDKNSNESDLGIDGGDVVGDSSVGVLGAGVGVGVVETDGNTNDGNEELAAQHTKGTDNQNGATTESLNGPE